jgi:hypothetical protein
MKRETLIRSKLNMKFLENITLVANYFYLIKH